MKKKLLFSLLILPIIACSILMSGCKKESNNVYTGIKSINAQYLNNNEWYTTSYNAICIYFIEKVYMIRVSDNFVLEICKDYKYSKYICGELRYTTGDMIDKDYIMYKDVIQENNTGYGYSSGYHCSVKFKVFYGDVASLIPINLTINNNFCDFYYYNVSHTLINNMSELKPIHITIPQQNIFSITYL